jgi:3-deoxy-manno-octulosonate cytidylyltransferase (CMP-KDO synthetase)
MPFAPKKPIIIIPARMTSVRLPGKPLADIQGMPMIVHVWRRAMESNIGPVIVACDSEEIASVIKKVGGNAVLTNPDHPSGSDRIWEALHTLEDNAIFDAVINVQGDLPTIKPDVIKSAYALLQNPLVDIGTLAVPIASEKEKNLPHVTKAVFNLANNCSHGRALYFSRLPVPSGVGVVYHHIGLYAYRRDALARFVTAPPSALELREKLEQLRALSLGLHIEVGVIDTVPLGVDTKEDLETARRTIKPTPSS